MEKLYEIIFPVRVCNKAKELGVLFQINTIVRNGNYNRVKFNFSRTKNFETNLLAVFSYFFEEFTAKNIKFSILLEKEYEEDSETMLKILFEYYSKDDRYVLYPRKIGNRHKRKEEQLLLSDLKELQLSEYEKVKILLSELIANLKMHTIYKDGSYAGYHELNRGMFIFSIVNYDITIANKIRQARNIEFLDDYAAIQWALRKNNSTRVPEETGGLGLYLLRKYISQLRGKFYIVSGNCFVEYDERCYRKDFENEIYYMEKIDLASRYEGTIITLYIPEQLREQHNAKSVLHQFDINTI